MWTNRSNNAAQVEVAGREIEGQTDRGEAIIATSILEECLENALLSHLRDDKKVTDKLFHGAGPLATFSAKIDLAYLVGVYDQVTRSKLHIIRQIRNEFAHSLLPIDFEAEGVRHRSAEIAIKPAIIDLMRQNYEKGKDGQLWQIMEPFLSAVVSAGESPRRSFIGAVKFYLFIITVMSAAKKAGSDSKGSTVLSRSESQTKV